MQREIIWLFIRESLILDSLCVCVCVCVCVECVSVCVCGVCVVCVCVCCVCVCVCVCVVCVWCVCVVVCVCGMRAASCNLITHIRSNYYTQLPTLRAFKLHYTHVHTETHLSEHM